MTRNLSMDALLRRAAEREAENSVRETPTDTTSTTAADAPEDDLSPVEIGDQFSLEVRYETIPEEKPEPPEEYRGIREYVYPSAGDAPPPDTSGATIPHPWEDYWIQTCKGQFLPPDEQEKARHELGSKRKRAYNILVELDRRTPGRGVRWTDWWNEAVEVRGMVWSEFEMHARQLEDLGLVAANERTYDRGSTTRYYVVEVD